MLISIVIPAYNEVKRLPGYLECVISYGKNNKNDIEVIVVDDASVDGTAEMVESYMPRFANLRLITLEKNKGKGYAVKSGFLAAQGDICVFMDADGSVMPDEIDRNLHYLAEYDIFIGSRVLKDKKCSLEARAWRKLIGGVFNFLVHIFLFREIKDSQCGFKMFKKKVVLPVFSKSRILGFGFDLEVLYLARKVGFKIKEGPVSWRHIDGSKINFFIDPIMMLINMLQIRLWHSGT